MDKKKDGGMPPEMGNAPPEEAGEGDRLAALEAKIDKIAMLVEQMAGAKMAGDDKDEDDKKIPGEKEKDGMPARGKGDQPDGEPSVDQKNTKLPKATAGETDETDKPKTDKVNFAEKSMNDAVDKRVNDILKSNGFTVTETPRSQMKNIAKSETAPKDMAMDFIEKAKTGQVSIGDFNRDVKKMAKQEHSRRMQAFNEMLDQEVA